MDQTKLQLVFSNPVEGRDDEFNEWYDNVHVPEILAIPGIVSAQRFDLFEAEITKNDALPPATHRYLAIYEMAGDIDEVMTKIMESYATGAMTMSEASDFTTSIMSFWTSRSPKVTP